MIRGVLFDLGSTLIRFDGDWDVVQEEGTEAMRQVLVDAGLRLEQAALKETFFLEMEQNQRERQVDHIERPMRLILQRALKSLGVRPPGSAIEAKALEAFFRVTERHWHLMPGAHSLLEGLRGQGLRLAIISNASDDQNVQRLIDKWSLRPWFDPIVVSAAVGVRKPHPRIFGYVLQQWDIPPDELAMVGDTLGEDILGAQRVHVHQVWITPEADTPSNRALAGVVIPECEAGSLADVAGCLTRLDGASA
jgi:putative hydrolase of the HAD superfamily